MPRLGPFLLVDLFPTHQVLAALQLGQFGADQVLVDFPKLAFGCIELQNRGLDLGPSERFAGFQSVQPRPGAYFLNTIFEWTCSTSAAPDPSGAGARMIRVLDWGLSSTRSLILWYDGGV